MQINRRKFLKFTSLSTLLSWLGLDNVFGAAPRLSVRTETLTGNATRVDTPKLHANPNNSTPTLVRWLVRPQDQLHVRLEFFNLKLNRTKTSLVRAGSGPAYIAIDFGPQHILEEIFRNENNSPAPPPPPVTSMLSGPSRLVFRLPGSLGSIPYKVDDLLSWRKLEPSLVPHGRRGSSWKVRPPVNTESYIEAPTGLFLSPDVPVGFWQHSKRADKRNSSDNASHNRFELWHTRYRVRSNPRLSYPHLRAVWSTDYKQKSLSEGSSFLGMMCLSPEAGENPKDPPCSPLTEKNQREIVDLTSNPDLPARRSVEARNLMLTSLGAWLDLKGQWKDQPGYDLIQWIHQTTMGRDHYVKVVERGYLLPFGHEAARIRISEREIGDDGEDAAYLRYIEFIVVREPIKTFSKTPGSANSSDARSRHQEKAGRAVPFASVELKTLVTPPIKPLDETGNWIVVEGIDYLFQVEAVDWNNNKCTSAVAMQFILATRLEYVDRPQPDLDTPHFHYNKSSRSRREMPLEGRAVCFAPVLKDDNIKVEPIHDTHFLRFKVKKIPRDLLKESELKIYPVMEVARVENLAVAKMTGMRDTMITFGYHDIYLKHGFSTDNEGKLYGKLSKGLPLQFRYSDRIGGIVVPNITITGLSARHGVVAGSDKCLSKIAEAGKLTTEFMEDFFGNEAKLFGGILLHEIVADDSGNIPSLVSQTVYDSNGLPEAVEVVMKWNPTLKGTDIFEPTGKLLIESTIRTPLKEGAKPGYSVRGELSNFKIKLLPVAGLTTFLEIVFDRLTFHSFDGQKPDFDVVLDRDNPVQFTGPLKYLDALQKNLPSDGFSDPPHVHVSSNKIDVGYDMRLPDVTAGAWGFANIAFGAGLTLPFDGKPMLARFAFADPQDTFRLTYSGLMGGGHFGLVARVDGVEEITGLFEVGANLELDFGPVARGSGYLKVGVSFVLKKQDEHSGVDLTGFVKTGGSMLAFSIAVISMEAQMKLTYANGRTSASGSIVISLDTPIDDLSAEIPWSYTLSDTTPNSTSDSNGALDNPERKTQLAVEDYTDEYFSAFAQA